MISEYTENIVTYIAGYVIRMLKKHIKCLTCLAACQVDNNTNFLLSKEYKLLERKQKGGLITPVKDVVKICIYEEKIIKRIVNITDNKVPAETNLQNIIVNNTACEFSQKNIFPQLNYHNLYENVIGEELHINRLISKITICYMKIRFNSIAKQQTSTIKGLLIRKK